MATTGTIVCAFVTAGRTGRLTKDVRSDRINKAWKHKQDLSPSGDYW